MNNIRRRNSRILGACCLQAMNSIVDLVSKVHNIYDLPDLGQQFDQIICFETLEHLLHDQRAVRIFADILRPGGRLHLCTPNKNCSFNARDISKVEDGGHVRVGYTHAELESLVRNAGLAPVVRDTVGSFGRIKATAIQRWCNTFLWAHLPPLAAEVARVFTFFILLPITWLDKFVPYPAWSVYVCAEKRRAT